MTGQHQARTQTAQAADVAVQHQTLLLRLPGGGDTKVYMHAQLQYLNGLKLFSQMP
jgi:hypothetical protein